MKGPFTRNREQDLRLVAYYYDLLDRARAGIPITECGLTKCERRRFYRLNLLQVKKTVRPHTLLLTDYCLNLMHEHEAYVTRASRVGRLASL